MRVFSFCYILIFHPFWICFNKLGKKHTFWDVPANFLCRDQRHVNSKSPFNVQTLACALPVDCWDFQSAAAGVYQRSPSVAQNQKCSSLLFVWTLPRVYNGSYFRMCSKSRPPHSQTKIPDLQTNKRRPLPLPLQFFTGTDRKWTADIFCVCLISGRQYNTPRRGFYRLMHW